MKVLKSSARTYKNGPTYLGKGHTYFSVWAPFAKSVDLILLNPARRIPLKARSQDYFDATVKNVWPGTKYFFRLNGRKDHPDPASRYQPQSVTGPSQLVDPQFPWTDHKWRGIALAQYIIYELHVGTFTPQGTFDGIRKKLPYLKKLGVTAIELMPVAQFPGTRNWGYDGVFPFAVQNSYGGPQGLKTLVNACHKAGLAVIMDVVYNHVGPEGNVLLDFGPYLRKGLNTPWGGSINYDGAHKNIIRRFFVENALMWLETYHVDALRLDAVHAIYDQSNPTFLEELKRAVDRYAKKSRKRVYLIPENNQNDSHLMRSFSGNGMDAQWTDDFHHALHTLLTSERQGYYKDYGYLWHLRKAMAEGFVYSGQYSRYRKTTYGNSSIDLDPSKFIVYSQNHDQVGNRQYGDRLTKIVSFEQLKLAAGTVLLSPYIPLIFMGEEYGETAPFQYFISHSNKKLIQKIRLGRWQEFRDFGWGKDIPDPQSTKTFIDSKLDTVLHKKGAHQQLLKFYSKLIDLRKKIRSIYDDKRKNLITMAYEGKWTLTLRRKRQKGDLFIAFNFSRDKPELALRLSSGGWTKIFDSADPQWGGSGPFIPSKLELRDVTLLPIPPLSFVVLSRGEKF